MIKLTDYIKDNSGNICYFTWNEALEYAKSKGTRLPTKEEIEELIEAGELKESCRSFWSGSPLGTDDAWFFDGLNGYVFGYHVSYGYAVRCLGFVPACIQQCECGARFTSNPTFHLEYCPAKDNSK